MPSSIDSFTVLAVSKPGAVGSSTATVRPVTASYTATPTCPGRPSRYPWNRSDRSDPGSDGAFGAASGTGRGGGTTIPTDGNRTAGGSAGTPGTETSGAETFDVDPPAPAKRTDPTTGASTRALTTAAATSIAPVRLETGTRAGTSTDPSGPENSPAGRRVAFFATLCGGARCRMATIAWCRMATANVYPWQGVAASPRSLFSATAQIGAGRREDSRQAAFPRKTATGKFAGKRRWNRPHRPPVPRQPGNSLIPALDIIVRRRGGMAGWRCWHCSLARGPGPRPDSRFGP